MTKVLENPIKNLKPAREDIQPEPMTVVQTIQSAEQETKRYAYPTELVNLPSKGLLYPPDNPLSSGVVEIKYITAKEEDILTTESYIRSEVVIDKLLQSLLATPINYDDLLVGDKNAIMVAARIYGYGKEYPLKVHTPSGNEQDIIVDLSALGPKQFDESKIMRGQNLFEFRLPVDGHLIEFQLITVGLQRKIDERLKKNKLSISKGGRDTQLTTRLGYMIQSINGETDPTYIRQFVDTIKALDSRALRNYITQIQPDIDLSVDVIDEETGEPFRTPVTIRSHFFWPDV